MKKSLVAVGAMLILAVAASPAAANHSWNNYHWARTANPFAVKLGDDLSANWKAYLQTTSSDWSKSTVLDTSIVAGNGTAKRCRATLGRDEICNGSYGNNGWLGLASISLSGSHITQGTVKLNDTYFTQAQYNNTSEREHVMCQEVGHTFGLDHQSTDGSSLNTCMDYYQNKSAADTLSIQPNPHDYDELAAIYAHLDSTTTLAASAPSSQASRGDTRPYRTERHDSSRSSTVTEYYSDGSRRVTHITWA